MSIKIVRSILSSSMFVKVQLIKEKLKILSKKEEQKLRKSMDSELRLYTDLLEVAVSQAALDKVNTYKICKEKSLHTVNLFDKIGIHIQNLIKVVKFLPTSIFGQFQV